MGENIVVSGAGVIVMMNHVITTLVTGASRGIGESVVRSFRARGYDVHALALDDDDLRRVAEETGATAHGVDIRDIGALEAASATSRSTSWSTTPACCPS